MSGERWIIKRGGIEGPHGEAADPVEYLGTVYDEPEDAWSPNRESAYVYAFKPEQDVEQYGGRAVRLGKRPRRSSPAPRYEDALHVRAAANGVISILGPTPDGGRMTVFVSHERGEQTVESLRSMFDEALRRAAQGPRRSKAAPTAPDAVARWLAMPGHKDCACTGCLAARALMAERGSADVLARWRALTPAQREAPTARLEDERSVSSGALQRSYAAALAVLEWAGGGRGGDDGR